MRRKPVHKKMIMGVSPAVMVIMAIMLSVSLFVSAQEKASDPVWLSKKVSKLKKDLRLSETQTAKVREIFIKEHEQRKKDREIFIDDAVKLILTAYDRRELTNLEIESLLEPGQKEAFKDVVWMKRFDRDLFEYTEGLCLNDSQAFAVEGILIDYYNAVKEFLPEEMEGVREGGRDGEPVVRRRVGGKMMSYMDIRHFGRLRAIMQEWGEKRDKAIKKVLTKHQKKLFRQLRKHRYKMLKEHRRKRARRTR